MTKVVIPNSTQYIWSYAFENCPKLTDVFIPQSVTFIDESAFEKSDNVVIHGSKTAAAEEFAKENNIPFVDINADTDSNPKTPQPTKTLYHGNIDGDDKITAADALKVLRASVKLEELTEEQAYFADVNGDNKIDSSDSLSILRYSVGFKDKGLTIGLE